MPPVAPVRPTAQPPAVGRPAAARPSTVQRRSAEPAPRSVPVPAAAPPPPPTPAARTATPANNDGGSTRTGTSDGRTGPEPSAHPAPETGPADLDDLARRLLAPLSRLLRAELRGDRERIGRLRDHGR
ncbi:hypothetical protein [Streptomyces sp. NPDC003032]